MLNMDGFAATDLLYSHTQLFKRESPPIKRIISSQDCDQQLSNQPACYRQLFTSHFVSMHGIVMSWGAAGCCAGRRIGCAERLRGHHLGEVGTIQSRPVGCMHHNGSIAEKRRTVRIRAQVEVQVHGLERSNSCSVVGRG
jgi:hypothetical protein